MRIFEMGDLVGYDSPEEGYIYGIVTDMTEKELEAEYLDGSWETFWIPKDRAEYIEPVYPDDEDIRKFARYEISFGDLVGDVFPPQRLRARERHMLTIDELLSVLRKASGMPVSQFRDEWFNPVTRILFQTYNCGEPAMEDEGDCGYRFLPSEGFYVWDAMDRVDNYLYDNYNDFSDVIEELEMWKSFFALPFEQRLYPDYCKAHYIKSFDNGMPDKATDDELALFIRFVDELCERNNKEALYAKAYGCYGGNRAFKCDWVTSRDCLEKLMEIDENPFVANTLGYIYYYGRCNGGQPEYEKAFKYYSIGAAGGVYESRYKLSDMFRHGYGVSKNGKIAASLIWELYNQNIEHILSGSFDNKFADVALRAGNLFRDGVNCEASPENAYYYYLQADFAVRMRMLETDYYGDAKVAESIEIAIGEVLAQTPYVKEKKTVYSATVEEILRYRCKKHRLLEMKVKKLKNGEFSLRFRVLPKGGEKYPPKLFVTEPTAHFCGMLDSITAKTVKCDGIVIGNKVLKANTSTVIFDSAEGDRLYLNGKLVAQLYCGRYRISLPKKGESEKYNFVSVAFHAGGRTYDYVCNIPDVKVGDTVIVETERGETEVEVIRMFEKDASETALPIKKYKSVLKKA